MTCVRTEANKMRKNMMNSGVGQKRESRYETQEENGTEQMILCANCTTQQAIN